MQDYACQLHARLKESSISDCEIDTQLELLITAIRDWHRVAPAECEHFDYHLTGLIDSTRFDIKTVGLENCKHKLYLNFSGMVSRIGGF